MQLIVHFYLDLSTIIYCCKKYIIAFISAQPISLLVSVFRLLYQAREPQHFPAIQRIFLAIYSYITRLAFSRGISSNIFKFSAIQKLTAKFALVNLNGTAFPIVFTQVVNLCSSLMNFSGITRCLDYIFIPKGCLALRFKGFSPTHLSPTPVAEFHGPLGDSR